MSKQKGFSLIELIVTISFIGISFAGILSFFTFIVKGYVENDIINNAVLLAQTKIEEIVADRNNSKRDISYVITSGRYPTEKIDQYTRSVSIVKHSLNGIPGYQCIITISHPSLNYNYKLTTFFNANNTLIINSNNYYSLFKSILLFIAKLLSGK